MHFIAEACYRRPLEPRGLVYSRGGTAITMGLLFLSFCGYLISQIHNDRPLIQISSEQIETDTDTPDIELCVQNSTLTVVKCTAMYYNWTEVDIPNCWERFFRQGANNEATKCYIFETNNTYRMAAGVVYDSRDALRRLDFYWNIDDLRNLSYSTVSLPAVAVQLYDPHFNTWKASTVGNTTIERETAINIQLGATRATTFLNYTSGIFYYPQKYRAIRPGDAASIIGLKPNYIDIMTLVNFQHDWPIRNNPPPPPPAFDKSLYQGLFSVQLAQSTIDVKTEVRQHTILAAIALAGGCYGVLTTIYILLFGMTRLTPWGLVHHIPVFISNRKNHVKDGMYAEEEGVYAHNSNNATTGQPMQHENDSKAVQKKNRLSTTVLIPWFFRSRLRGDKTYTTQGRNDTFMRHMITRKEQEKDDKENHQMESLNVGKSHVQDSPELRLLDTKDRQRNSLSSSNSSNSLNEQYVHTPANPSPPILSPHYTMPMMPGDGSSSSRQYNDQSHLESISSLLRLEQERSVKLEERSTELSNRVEELEVILSEYFINTDYLDQLRARKNSKLVPATTESESS
ncbi:uncharacterized protein ATC70_010772 [Mucor velutinosus]|uniref:Uncharacterized protein n=1 Tax=Mucor velutinosus TaxID=708070 RepID=A0AAN7DF56_9FUNG|nr:hypothetical protein ATC70_010772 [Mucor velutinosus]